MNDMTERFQLVDEFSKLLTASRAASNKSRGPAIVDGELAFVVNERRDMLDGINTRRAKRGLPSIDAAEYLRKVDRRAVGHSDYGHKLCLYATFLSMGID